nr:hypothetical protein [Ktedonobacter racemifer]
MSFLGYHALGARYPLLALIDDFLLPEESGVHCQEGIIAVFFQLLAPCGQGAVCHAQVAGNLCL